MTEQQGKGGENWREQGGNFARRTRHANVPMQMPLVWPHEGGSVETACSPQGGPGRCECGGKRKRARVGGGGGGGRRTYLLECSAQPVHMESGIMAKPRSIMVLSAGLYELVRQNILEFPTKVLCNHQGMHTRAMALLSKYR